VEAVDGNLSSQERFICGQNSAREPRNLNKALVKPMAETLTAGIVRWAHYVHFLTMMRAQLRSCMTGQMVVWDACTECRSGWQCVSNHIHYHFLQSSPVHSHVRWGSSLS